MTPRTRVTRHTRTGKNGYVVLLKKKYPNEVYPNMLSPELNSVMWSKARATQEAKHFFKNATFSKRGTSGWYTASDLYKGYRIVTEKQSKEM